jgi:hypothetical protein
MSTQKQLLPIAFAAAASLGIYSNTAAAGVLYPDPTQNVSLGNGDYAFVGAHPADTTFLDQLQFTLADAGAITATVNNSSVDLPAAAAGSNLLSNQFLMISLFDNSGNFISAAGAGGTLSASGLSSGITYTLAISGKTNGIFGGVYDGQVNVDAAAVPLPTALPGFTAALLTLGWRRKKSEAV